MWRSAAAAVLLAIGLYGAPSGAAAAPARSIGVPSSRTPFPRFTGAAPVGIAGARLTLGGSPHQFVGLNAYELATAWGENFGCGGMESNQQLDAFFAGLPAHSLVRIWGLQGSMAINIYTHQLDWAPLQRVFDAAAAHDQYLIVSLAGVGGVCDNGHWTDPSWFGGGFTQVFDNSAAADPAGHTPLSYWDYVQAIVSHFASSPALAMWEPYSEAEASTCPSAYQPFNCSGHQTCPEESVAAGALRYFFDVVGGEIHAIDPAHPVEDGLLSSGQCGTEGSDWAYVSASPGIDVLNYHDYYPTDVLIGGDDINGEAAHFSDASQLGKPIIAGEMGVPAGGRRCPTLVERSIDIWKKTTAQMADGASAVLPWNWETDLRTGCSYNINPGDPLLAVVSTLGR